MTDSIDPNATNNIASTFLPRIYRTDANTKFLQATVEQVTQQGTVTKLNGYIGRQSAKATTGNDVFISASNSVRQNYQLEPSIVINDQEGNNSYFKDYQDYINTIKLHGGNVSNHSRINSEEFYSWDPKINWDKFVNFQNYYWIKPNPITISGQQLNITSEYSVKTEVSYDNTTNYVFTPDGVSKDPLLVLYRGQTYKFLINAPGNPMSIKSARTLGITDLYNTGVVNNTIEDGILEFTIPTDAPDILYYQSETNVNIGGMFKIDTISALSFIDVEQDLIGKVSYTLPNGVTLSNGMIINFTGNIIPSSYASGTYFVEGVGEYIKLISADYIEQTTTPEYIVINRSSNDKSSWTRINQWVSETVLEISNQYSSQTPISFNQDLRATRPIIEFDANLKLINYGSEWLMDVDLIDENTIDGFSLIEGSSGYYIDTVKLQENQLIILLNDLDDQVKNNIYKVLKFGELIHLELVHTPVINQVIYVKNGSSKKSVYYWFNGVTWVEAQQKTYKNQPPLFDVVDSNGISFSDNNVYNGTTFAGTKLFSYKIGSSVTDTVLGFPLSYRNINNIGDIVFNFNFVNDTFNYKKDTQIIDINVNSGYLIYKNYNNDVNYSNGWVKSVVTDTQAAVRIYKNSQKVNNFDIDIFDDIQNLSDLKIHVYLNGSRVHELSSTLIPNWVLINKIEYKQLILLNSSKPYKIETISSGELSITDTTSLSIGQEIVFSKSFVNIDKNKSYYISSILNITKFTISETINGPIIDVSTNLTDLLFYVKSDILTDDVLTIRAFSNQSINDNGYYEIPNNLQNNPLNGTISDFTLGEVINHVDSIVENLSNKFIGVYPGKSNLRDLVNLSSYGTKFVKHSGPASISMYHLTSDNNNVVKAIEQSRDNYGKFKRKFLSVAETLGVDTDVKTHVDLILQSITKNISNTSSYYFSDMVPFGASIKSVFKIAGFTTNQFPLTNPYDMNVLSNRAVGVYLNGVQLIINHEYTFNNQGYLDISIPLVQDDEIVIYEYENTDGCFIPATPSKLGIWPLYDPKIYKDTSLVTPQWVIQGHDGSHVLAYGNYDDNNGDFRDQLILELEKRIYNNVKIKYDPSIFDITDILPNYSRQTEYSLSEFNDVLSSSFYNWTSLVDVDHSTNTGFDITNPFTYNYKDNYILDSNILPGYWRGIYKWVFDTDRPHLCPWEMLGEIDKPTWWDSVYGPAPYTSDNLVLWEDISKGILNIPSSPVILKKYKKSFLIDNIPVDENGNLRDPISCGLIKGPITNEIYSSFVFGDSGPVESAWKRSSYFPFSVILTSILLKPSKILGLILDRSRISRNLTGQLVYEDTGSHIISSNIKIPSIYSSSYRIQTSGIINYVVDYIISENLNLYNQYAYDLSNLYYVLSYRVGGFTSKTQFNLILDSKSPLTTGNVYIPQDDYNIILNTSTPVNKITYSGVIITKTYSGFSVKGYSKSQPYFKYYKWLQSGSTINVGGISDSYVVWTSGKSYTKGQIVNFNNNYYVASSNIYGDVSFDMSKYTHIPTLPIVGGKNAIFRKLWDRKNPITIPYNTTFDTIQEVVDFLIGYGEWLKDQGFIFDEFNTNLNHVSNWETSAKEFMFWTTQNWSAGEDTWDEWVSDVEITFNSIVKYNGEYFKALRNILATGNQTFNYDYFEKLSGLSSVGSSVISLSPAAESLTFLSNLTVVDDITNQFNDYEFFKVDGQAIQPQYIDSYRNKNLVTYKPNNDDGIYNASFYLVQKEHVVLLNNTTMFNDLIYDATSGYKQDRIKISAYISSNWYGGFDAPGFIFDDAIIHKWESWKSYAVGDIVKYQSFYYSANSYISGSSDFDNTKWVKLSKKPSSKLIPNWTNLATQFTDFYSLDDEHFDSYQQTMAQHLIGYQKRQYLDNIITDDVSEFKFYQGMIKEKGTQNVFNKLFGVLSNSDKDSLTFYEEWALRVGQYGASSAFNEIEFILNEEKFKANPQEFKLVNTISNDNGYVIQQTPSELYIKPVDYNSTILPISSSKKVLRSGGYVRPNDVSVIVSNISEITSHDISQFSDGDYIWCTFYDISWNVFRYTSTNISVSSISYNSTNSQLTLTVSNDTNILPNDYVGVIEFSKLSGFYKVVSNTSNTMVLSAPGIKYEEPLQINNIKIYHLTSQRANSIDNAAEVLHYPLKSNELLWTDDNGTGKWSSWIYNSVYSGSILKNPYPTIDGNYGRSIASDKNGKYIIVSTANGEVYVYRNTNAGKRLQQVISKPFISLNDQNPNNYFGKVVSLSKDGTWLAIGSPYIGNACTQFNNVDIKWDDSNIQFSNTAVLFDINLQSTKAGNFVIGNTYTITNIGNTNFTLIGASKNSIGVIFTATQVGTGTGAAVITPPVSVNTIVIGGSYTIYSLGDTNFIELGALHNRIGEVFIATHVGSGTGTVVKNIVNSSSNLVFTNISGYNSTFTNQGVVSLYTQDKNKNYYLVGTFVSPNPSTNEFFGSSLEFGTNTLYIGASDNQYKGVVYKINYNMIVNAQSIYDPYNSFGTTVNLITSPGINVFDMYVVNDGFSDNQKVISYNSTKPTTLTLDSPPNFQPTGVIKFVTYNWQYEIIDTLYGDQPNDNFGLNIKISDDDSTLLISSLGKVSIYTQNNHSQTVVGTSPEFGNSITVSNNGEFIAISESAKADTYTDQGAVYIYTKQNNALNYTIYQTIKNLYPEANAEFGFNMSFMDNYDTLVVHSRYANSPSSHIDIYDRYGSKWVYSERLPLLIFNVGSFIIGQSYTIISLGTTTNQQWNILAGTTGVTYTVGSTFVAETTNIAYGSGTASINLENDNDQNISLVVSGFSILIGTPYEHNQYDNSGLLYEYKKDNDIYSWSIKNKEIDKPDISKVKKAFLYNKKTNALISYLDVIDPLQGKIAGIAEQELSYKTMYDPAIYSIGNSTVNIDTGMAWTSNHVGKLWWDLRTSKFIESFEDDETYRESTWNTLVYGSTVDIYEWVQTDILPDDWDTQADTEAGLANGISGTSLYGNNCYSIKTYFDNVSKTLKNTYFYWVKNKVITPNVVGRYNSAQNVSNLIANPLKNAYKYISFTSNNTFHLSNIGHILEKDDVVLSIQNWIIDNTDQNIHTEWKIISNDPSSNIPPLVEQKWIDSLCGVDDNGRLVPDVSLPSKLKYGIENRPRQGMFVNRFEAVKQLIEQANNILIKNQISNTKDLSILEQYDSYPSVSSGVYDLQIDTDLELQFINVSSYNKAILLPIIIDGKIVDVTIAYSGIGYINPPTIKIIGTGINAILKTTINTKGQIDSVSIVNTGDGYDDTTELVVRDFTALVLSDTQSNSKWALYFYDLTTRSWSRTLIQSYDNRNYWEFVDWYSDGYNQFTSISQAVDIFSDLQDIETKVGDIIKIRYANNGKWVLLKKFNDLETLDWTMVFSIIGIEQGTIQFSPLLYNSVRSQYDGTIYDNIGYDNTSTVELRNILYTIKNNIFINDLKQEYLNLFFNSIRYVFNEQNYVDWIFKSSFVKATHNAGMLNQPVSFKNDNLADYEKYVAEVKPYRTKVREYVSNYTNIDTGVVSVSDFDLPPIYTKGGTNVIDATVSEHYGIISYNSEIKSYPWKSWYDNVGYSVVEIEITEPGYGYSKNNLPVITINGSGKDAYAVPVVDDLGTITGINIINGGYGYLSTPTVVISEPVFGNPATAIARLGGGFFRTNKVAIKFDRISKNYYITTLNQTETFIATNGQLEYILSWAPDIKIGNSIVYINNKVVTSDLYSLEIVTDNLIKTKLYMKYYGKLKLSNTLTINTDDEVKVFYNKDISILNSTDRIKFYYNPLVNNLGNDINQVMNGIDYGGVLIDGVSFDINKGWDSLPFLSDRWDSYDPTFTDYTVKVELSQTNKHAFTLPYIPSNGTIINVYCNGVRIDDLHFNTILQTNSKAIMKSPVIGTVSDEISIETDGSITINIPLIFKVNVFDIFTFRESTSDGSIKTFDDDYDTSYDGGNLLYTTATGFTPSDLIVDGGDKFVTPLTSNAPEEMVPGHVVDTLSIKVFEQNETVSGNIKVTRFVANGSNNSFNIGQKLNTINSVIVVVEHFTKFDDEITSSTLIKTIDDDYTIDYKNNLVVFNTPPDNGDVVSLYSIGINSTNIVDFGFILADGNNILYTTKTMYYEQYILDVYIDGVRADFVKINSTSYLCILFSNPPKTGSIISYIVVNSQLRTYTITSNEQVIIPVGGLAANTPIQISSIVGYAINNEKNMIVIVNQQILQPTEYTYLSNSISFSIGLNNSDKINIISSCNNAILDVHREEQVVSSIISTVDTPAYFYDMKVYGGELTLSKKVKNENYIWVIKNGIILVPGVDFVLNDDKQSILLSNDPLISDVFDIITFNSNTTSNLSFMQFKDMLNRTFYKDIDTSKQTILTEDLRYDDLYIKVDDISIFDIPNPSKNIPGVIEIGTERIEYFEIKGNSLGQLRRSTLGTGAATVYSKGTTIQNIGPSSNISYKDRTVTYNIKVTQSMINNNNCIDVDFTPSRRIFNISEIVVDNFYTIASLGTTTNAQWNNIAGTSGVTYQVGSTFKARTLGINFGTGTVYIGWGYKTGFITSIPSNYGQCDDIEVFIGGYDIKNWGSNVIYSVGDIVLYGSYTYKCENSHISGNTFNDNVTTVTINNDKTTNTVNTNVSSNSVWKLFDTSIRLKKEPYRLFNINNAPYSPAGDVQFDADYSVDGTTKHIRLTNTVPVNTVITIVKKYGSVWNNKYAIL